MSARAYLRNNTILTPPNFCACSLRPWLGPPLTALRYVMHFRFCGWHHAFTQWALWCIGYNSTTVWTNIDSAAGLYSTLHSYKILLAGMKCWSLVGYRQNTLTGCLFFNASLTISIIERKRSWYTTVAYSSHLSVCLSGKCLVAKRLIGSGRRLEWWVGLVY